MQLLIASTNPGKLREIQAILTGLPFQLLLPGDLGLELDVAETGSSFAENAALKAQAYCQASRLLCLSDDSGLEVDALDGAPGLHSARYSPDPRATDADRRALLLKNLSRYPIPEGTPGWPAHFTCTVAVAVPQGELQFAHGRCDGFVVSKERGQNGFGYDPIFFMPEFGRTMAELPDELKNQVSHRGRAIRAALPILQSLRD